MTTKSIFKLLFATVLIALFSVSCFEKDNLYPGFSKTDNGLYYKFHIQSTDTLSPQDGDNISAHMIYRTSIDGVDTVFSKNTSGVPFQLMMKESEYKGDIYEALGIMTVGDSATFVINTDSFFQISVGAPAPALLDSGSYFFLDVMLVEVKSPEQMDKERMERERAMAQMEAQIIQEYLTVNNINAINDPSGIFLVNTKEGKGEQLKAGSVAKLNLIAKVIGPNGGEFLNTHTEGRPFDYEVGTGQLGMGFETGIMKMKEGGKLTIISPFSMAFGAQGIRGYVPAFATVVYDVELVKISTREEVMAEQEKMMKEAQANEVVGLNKYLRDNNIFANPTASGLYYVEEVVGTGKQAIAGSTVKVHYSGYLLDGTKFDSSVDRGMPFEFKLGQGQVIPGWDEGIAMMKEGGKAKLIIPSIIGYGSRGSGMIPPFSTLMFEVQLIEVID